VLRAEQIVRGFAGRYGWLNYLRKPAFESVEIFGSQLDLWRRVQQMENLPAEQEMPTSALAAGVEKGILLAVTPEEYMKIRPEYASLPRAWRRLLAHEMAHQLHERLVKEPDAMGPTWFFEGFALVAAGQNLCRGVPRIESFDEAMSCASRVGTGSYVFYELALRFFLRRIPIGKMIREAGSKNFEDWLRVKTAAKNVE
jgi:hypothetical protein